MHGQAAADRVVIGNKNLHWSSSCCSTGACPPKPSGGGGSREHAGSDIQIFVILRGFPMIAPEKRAECARNRARSHTGQRLPGGEKRRQRHVAHRSEAGRGGDDAWYRV